jgi:formate hydrogenlyase subunit 3/multisubunit Na+/H+ antiporter MnhD subunit
LKLIGLYLVAVGCLLLLIGVGYNLWIYVGDFNLIVIQENYTVPDVKMDVINSLFATIITFIGFLITLIGLISIIKEKRSARNT